VPAQHSFEFATIRLVPRVERGEFINAGVILLCLGKKYLRCLLHVDAERAGALWPAMDMDEVHRHLAAFPEICEGAAEAGPIARLTQRERFLWLVAPRSTVIQISPVHSGLCESPEAAIRELFERLVLP
jgi:hypothetical protein